MDSNTHSVAWLDRLAALETDLDQLATQPLDSLTDTALVEGRWSCGGWPTGGCRCATSGAPTSCSDSCSWPAR